MSRDPIALSIPDLSAFAKAVRADLTAPPGHQEMLNILARAAGFRNYQHLLARRPLGPPEADAGQVARALRYFDGQGRFARWPARTQVQKLCLWALWAALPPRHAMTERQISARIDALSSFRDAAQIRRAMVEHRMVSRTVDGSAYLRIEQAPPPEALHLTDRLKLRETL